MVASLKNKALLIAGLSLMILVPLTGNAHPYFKSGFKAGFGLGYKQHRAQNITEASPTTYGVTNFVYFVEARKKSHNDSGFSAIHLGYDWVKDAILASMELDYRYSPGKAKMPFDLNNGFYEPNTKPPYLVKQSHRHDLGVTLNLGRIILPRVAIYAIGSLRLGQFEHRFYNDKASVVLLDRKIAKKQYRFGAGGGVGARYALGQNWTADINITYDVYKKIILPTKSLIDDNNMLVSTFSTRSKRPHILNVLFKISKTF